MVKLIVAKALNNAIGKNNQLIWHLPDEMKYFTKNTGGHVVVMGRKNWDSIPLKFRPLAGRINVVVTRNAAFKADGCFTVSSIAEAIEKFGKQSGKDIFIIGGGQIYSQAIAQNLVEEMLITEVAETFDADTFFPSFDESRWTKTNLGTHEKDEKHPYAFTFFKYSLKTP
jgi:dihydrofolate reductase